MSRALQAVREAVTAVWSALGAGHSEAVYHAALQVELGFSMDVYHLSSGRCVPIIYKGHAVGRCELDLDFTDEIETVYILELKAVKTLTDEHAIQCARYRRLFGNQQTRGILINFGSQAPEVKEVVSL